jgi:Spy/CpxP family protein refolding chaperone
MRAWMMVAACLATAALAQPGPQGGMPMKPDYAKALGIPAEKAAQVEGILTAEREQHRVVHEKARADLSKILTAQQLESLERMLPRGGGPGGRGPGGPGGERGGPPERAPR